MSEQWVEVATKRLRDQHACPGCGTVLTSTRCEACGLVLSGPWAVEVLRASRDAAAALDRRAAGLRALRSADERLRAQGAVTGPEGPALSAASPTGTTGTASPPSSTPGGTDLPGAARPQPPARRQPPVPVAGAAGRPLYTAAPAAPARSSVGLQPILASAGAGLLAVATIVFVFFTLADDLAVRALVTGVVTLLALGAAAFLRLRGMGASAESIGALGVVLLLVDVELFLSAGLLGGTDPALARGLLLLVVSAGLLVGGHRVRMRTWSAAGLVLAPVVPVVLAGAVAGGATGDLGTQSGAFAVGMLAACLVTLLELPVARVSGARLGSRLVAETTVLQVARYLVYPTALLVGLAVPPVSWLPGWSGAALLMVGGAATAAILARCTGQRLWWWVTGAVAVLAAVLLGVGHATWSIGLAPVAGLVAGAALVAAATAARATAQTREALVTGALAVFVAATLPAVGYLASRVLLALTSARATGPQWSFTDAPLAHGGMFDDATTTAALVGVGALALALLGVSVLRLGTWLGSGARAGLPWVVLFLLAGTALHPAWAAVTSSGLLAALALALVVLADRWAAARRAPWSAPVLTGVFALTGMAAVVSWSARPTAVLGGAVVLGLLLLARRVVPAGVRPYLVGLGYGYALLVLGMTLGWVGLTGVEALAVVSVTASVVAIVVTRLRVVDRPSWWAVLVTTSVPFLLGVATVLEERSYWSAAAAATMLALEAVLVLTRRPGMTRAVRVAAAGLLLPTASVVLVCLGAELVPGSGSPVVLPLVAILTAAAAVAVPQAVASLGARGLPDAHTGAVGRVVEVSTLVTAAVAVLLSLVRVSAGPETAMIVLLVLGTGAAVVAGRPDRRWVWWLAAALWVGALWSLLSLLGVGLVEAYTAPPALAAVVVGGLLARRGPGGRRLVAGGLALLVVPSLLVSILLPDAGPWRNPALLGLGLVLVIGGEVARRLAARGARVSASWARDAATYLSLAAVLASVGGLAAALRFVAASGGGDPTATYLGALAWSAAGAGLAALAGYRTVSAASTGPGATGTGPDDVAHLALAPSARRWWAAPAMVLAVVGPVAAVGESWTAIVLTWSLEVVLLVLVVHTVRQALHATAPEDLRWPPAWFVWGLALVTAVGAWSPRELRVEVFSLPLGAGLLVAGYLAFVASSGTSAGAGAGPATGLVPVARLADWPVGFVGSWRTLAVGIAATLGPSVLATYTDARTWRAVLVVGLALAAVLVGTRFHLAAPFVLGVVVLPVEILVVFVSQLGTAISAGPWMLTLTAAGGLLLILAVYYERRMAAFDGAAAYLRDLR
ncbi:SCO7613 C-terminal domain-containing membrane protein [Oerskovia sp. NPDC060287]|uniref:SCO7613 C-terminal domain-containing membrane protein n=1 Tax=Oerskovia sp. NPDC060287 TaxID=3347095 RepID=UPI0036592CFC